MKWALSWITDPWQLVLTGLHMSCLMTKPTKWPVCPLKTWIILGICPVWSVLAVRSVSSCRPKLSSCGHSYQTGRMPRLIRVLAGRKCRFVGFVMKWLNYEEAKFCLPVLCWLFRGCLKIVLAREFTQIFAFILLSGCRPSHFLVQAISYEQCMLGFWKFIYGFLMEK